MSVDFVICSMISNISVSENPSSPSSDSVIDMSFEKRSCLKIRSSGLTSLLNSSMYARNDLTVLC